MGENISKQWVDGGIVDIGNGHAFFQVVENHDTWATTESTKRFLMQFGPDACTRAPSQQAHGLSAVTERQNEQPCPPIFAAVRIAHHRTTAVVDLGFFSGSSQDDARRFRTLRSAKLPNKAFHRLIAASKTVVRHQVLPNRHGIPAKTESQLDPRWGSHELGDDLGRLGGPEFCEKAA